MFDLRSFKSAALNQLKGRWKVPCIATLILIAVFAVIEGSSALTYGTIGGILSTFVYGSSAIAFTNIFILLYLSNDKITFSDFVNGFSDFLKGFLGMLWMSLWIFLWSLLFVIPGFIKSLNCSCIEAKNAPDSFIASISRLDFLVINFYSSPLKSYLSDYNVNSPDSQRILSDNDLSFLF